MEERRPLQHFGSDESGVVYNCLDHVVTLVESSKSLSPDPGGDVSEVDSERKPKYSRVKASLLGNVGTPHRNSSSQRAPKRKLFIGPDDENTRAHGQKRPLPKRKSIAKTLPLTERQQLALLLQLTSNQSQTGLNHVTPPQNNILYLQSQRLGKKSILKWQGLSKRNKLGETPLHLATIKGDLEQVKSLLKQGADIHSRDYAGWTVLHEACNHGHYEVAEILLNSGADVDARGFDNFTPLHDASVNGHLQLVKLLLKHGADPSKVNTHWKTPRDLASNPVIILTLEEFARHKSYSISKSVGGKKHLGSQEDLEGGATHFPGPLLRPTQSTMRKNSLQNQNQKAGAAEKPTSPRLLITLKKTNERSVGSKALDASSSQPKYQAYCVTMETRDNPASHSSKKEETVSSSQNAPVTNPSSSSSSTSVVTASQSLSCVAATSSGNPPRAESFEVSSSSTNSSAASNKDATVVSTTKPGNTNEGEKITTASQAKKQSEKVDSTESLVVKVSLASSGARSAVQALPSFKLSSPASSSSKLTSSADKVVADLSSYDFNSDNEKEESKRKRRKSSDPAATPSVASSSGQPALHRLPRQPLPSSISETIKAEAVTQSHNSEQKALNVSQTSVSSIPTSVRVSVGGSQKTTSSTIPVKKKVPDADTSQKDESVEKKAESTTSASSTSATPATSATAIQSSSLSFSNTPACPHSPKVPPLKIVIGGLIATGASVGGPAGSGGSGDASECRERAKITSSKPVLPYVVSAAASTPSNQEDPAPSGLPESSSDASVGACNSFAVTNSSTNFGSNESPTTSTTGISRLGLRGTEEECSGSTTKDNAPSSSFAGSSSSCSNTPSKTKEEERFQRVTRSSQRMQQALATAGGGGGNGEAFSSASSSRTEHSGDSSTDEHPQPSTHSNNGTESQPPRKRKLKTKESGANGAGCSSSTGGMPPDTNLLQGCNNNNPPSSFSSSSSQSSSTGDDQPLVVHAQNTNTAGPSSGGPGAPNTTSGQPHPPQQQLLNCYQMFLNIRKEVDKRRKAMFVVHPKPPQGFKDYLLNRCSYVLEGNTASRISVPTIPPPQTLSASMKDLFILQEKERYKLRLQHLIEREKLVLSAEQEILRVHGRAARAMANQTIPLSVCTILKDEEIYNSMELEQDDKDKNVRSRYNGRLFLSWLQDVDDKWEKIKEATLLRHHNEAESLHAVQKLDWEWKMKELAMCEVKVTPVIDDIYVPMVHVSDDFDLLPTPT